MLQVVKSFNSAVWYLASDTKPVLTRALWFNPLQNSPVSPEAVPPLELVWSSPALALASLPP